jgi:hypothetical protein
MKRVIAWVVLVLCLLGVVKLAGAWSNPWSKTSARSQARLVDDGPSAAALWIPSCADKVDCR